MDFFDAFEFGLGITRTEFGLAIGIQMLFWGMFAPIFGLLADKFGGNKAFFLGFVVLPQVFLCFILVLILEFVSSFGGIVGIALEQRL